MTDSTADAAAVTVSYNSSRQLLPFLASIRRDQPELYIVVADNASTDGAESVLACEAHRALFLELDDNRGYGSAINAAIRALPDSVRFVLISNPDVIVEPGAIQTLTSHLIADSSIAAVGPRVLNADGTLYPSARNLPSLRSGVGHALFSHVWPNNPWSRAYRAESSYDDSTRTVGWLSGSCLMVRRSAFEALGGFDERYFMYFEDVDLGYRLGKSGLHNLYVPSATVTHSGAHSTTAESGKMLKAHHDSAYRYLEKKYSGPYLAPLRWVLRVGLAIRVRLLTLGR